MKKIVIWILVIIFIFNYFPAAGEETYQIKVINIKGEVKIETTNPLFGLFGLKVWKKLEQGDSLEKGDIIKTGRDSFLELSFHNGTNTYIEENSQIIIGENKKKEKGIASTLKVNKGRIWARVKRAWKEITKFKVITPSVVAGVKGTKFTVAVNDYTVVSVKEGIVQLIESKNNKKVLVDKGMMSTVSKGKLEGPYKMDKKEKKLWNNKEVKTWLNKDKNKQNPGKGVGHNKEKDLPENAQDNKNSPPHNEDKGKKGKGKGNKKDKEIPDKPDESQDNNGNDNRQENPVNPEVENNGEN